MSAIMYDTAQINALIKNRRSIYPYQYEKGKIIPEETKPYFELESNDRLLGFFYIGYVAKPLLTPSKRGAIQEKVKWIDTNHYLL